MEGGPDIPLPQSKTRPEVVVSQHSQVEQEAATSSTPHPRDRNRRLPNRLGSMLRRHPHRGMLEHGRGGAAHQRSGTPGSTVRGESLCPGPLQYPHSSTHGQHDYSCPCQPPRRDKVTDPSPDCDRALADRGIARHLLGLENIADFMSRHLVDRLDWMLNPRLFQIPNQQLGLFEVDLFATRLTRQLPTFYSWRPDRVDGSGCPGPELEPIEGVRTPSLVPDSLQKVMAQRASVTLIAPVWPSQPWYSTLFVATNRPSTAPYSRASNPTPLTELQVAHGREPPTTGCMEGLRRQLSAKGAPGDAADLIFHSWRTKTNSNYNSAWRKWAQRCSNREENPFSAPIASFLGFLDHQFSLGREYRSLNVYRSAISSTHLPVDGFPVGQHPLVSSLLKGVFNTRPPRPRYTSVSHVTDFLKSMGEPKDLPVPLLTKKLAILLALVSAQRSSDCLYQLQRRVTELGCPLPA